MSALRLVMPGCALLLVRCWSVTACHPHINMRRPGFAASYVPPMANLTVDKLQGQWYTAEQVTCHNLPQEVMKAVCFILDFHYDGNGILVVEQLTRAEGVTTSTENTCPVRENGLWDESLFTSHEVVDWSDDDRYLAVAKCANEMELRCETFVLVRHIEDAGRHDELTELHRRLASVGVRDADCGFPRDMRPCRPGAPDAEGPSAAETQWKPVKYSL